MQVSDRLNGYQQGQSRVFQVKSTREGARREGRQRAESGGVECGLVGGTKKLCDVPVLKFRAQCLQNIGICARDTSDKVMV